MFVSADGGWRDTPLSLAVALRDAAGGFDVYPCHGSGQRDAVGGGISHPDVQGHGLGRAAANRHGDCHDSVPNPAAKDYDDRAQRRYRGRAVLANADLDRRDGRYYLAVVRKFADGLDVEPFHWSDQRDAVGSGNSHPDGHGDGLGPAAANRLGDLHANHRGPANDYEPPARQLSNRHAMFVYADGGWRDARLCLAVDRRAAAGGFDVESFHWSGQRDPDDGGGSHATDVPGDGLGQATAKRHGEHHDNGHKPTAKDYDDRAQRRHRGRAVLANADCDWRDGGANVAGDLRDAAVRFDVELCHWSGQRDADDSGNSHAHVPGDGREHADAKRHETPPANHRNPAYGCEPLARQLFYGPALHIFADGERGDDSVCLAVDLRDAADRFDVELCHWKGQRDSDGDSAPHAADVPGDGLGQAAATRHGEHHDNGHKPTANHYDDRAQPRYSGRVLLANANCDWRDGGANVEGEPGQATGMGDAGPIDRCDQRDPDQRVIRIPSRVPGDGLWLAPANGDGGLHPSGPNHALAELPITGVADLGSARQFV